MVIQVRVIADTPQRAGGLLTRLMDQFFTGLGYSELSFDVHKTGREVDVQGRGRLEPRRRLYAECKATAEPIGGSDANKFAGVLDAESRRLDPDEELTGYLVSLGGFTESLLEQERELGEQRFITVDGAGVARELASSQAIPSVDAATEIALSRLGLSGDVATSDARLLGTEIGWCWALTIDRNHETVGFVLVHSDRRLVAARVATNLDDYTGQFKDRYSDLQYLFQEETADRDPSFSARYLSAIKREHGSITLEGLPTDAEVGGQSLSLEDLYVPQRLVEESVGASSTRSAAETKSNSRSTETVQEVMKHSAQLAVLGPPGAGKSTLVKWLATHCDPQASADSQEREGSTNALPWLPVVIRCRQLGGGYNEPVRDLLFEKMSDLSPTERASTEAELLARLHDGSLLVLLDGLDEIQDETNRALFVERIDEFISLYPAVRVVTTSRHAGFRIVAGKVASFCDTYALAGLSDDDIARLSAYWYEAVSPSAVSNGDHHLENLVATITGDPRLKELASTPLLLTILLLVHRWVGDFPKKRTMLYDKAIEALLMTWNVAGHRPVQLEEAIPQLSYVAFAMLDSGSKQLSSRHLEKLLRDARTDMPELLAYTKTSVQQFVDRVEQRSSILIQSGHVRESGRVLPLYEYRHTTFQEYLAALALAEGYLPRRTGEADLVSQVSSHLLDDGWTEVIPLSAVLAGRSGGAIVEFLVQRLRELNLRGDASIAEEDETSWQDGGDAAASVVGLLTQCLEEEVPLVPEVAKSAVEWTCRLWTRGGDLRMTRIAESKYGQILAEVSPSVLLGEPEALPAPLEAAAAVQIVEKDIRADWPQRGVSVGSQLVASEDDHLRAVGYYLGMLVAFESVGPRLQVRPGRSLAAVAGGSLRSFLQESPSWDSLVDSALANGVSDRNAVVRYAANWMLAWAGGSWLLKPEATVKALAPLVRTWREGTARPLRRQAAWAIWSLPLVDRNLIELDVDPEGMRGQLYEAEGPRARDHALAALVVGHYVDTSWAAEDLIYTADVHPSIGRGPHHVIEAIAKAHGLDSDERLQELLAESETPLFDLEEGDDEARS